MNSRRHNRSRTPPHPLAVRWSKQIIATVRKLPPPAVEYIDAFKDELREILGGKARRGRLVRLRRKGIVGFGFGVKISDGEVVGHQCIRVYVREKKHVRRLPSTHLVPKYINGLPTDVIVLPAPIPHAAWCGESVGHPAVTFGTIGCVVEKADGTRFILSNNHVLANCNQPGATTETWQPGPSVGGGPPPIGHLADFEPLKFGGPLNDMDAAISILDNPASVSPRIMGLGGPLSPNPVLDPLSATLVQKFGAFTQLRSGLIEGIREDVPLEFKPFGIAHFQGQLAIRGEGELFSDGGDSGALVVTKPHNRPVALLVGGDIGAGLSFATPIVPVLSRFQVTVVV